MTASLPTHENFSTNCLFHQFSNLPSFFLLSFLPSIILTKLRTCHSFSYCVILFLTSHLSQMLPISFSPLRKLLNRVTWTCSLPFRASHSLLNPLCLSFYSHGSPEKAFVKASNSLILLRPKVSIKLSSYVTYQSYLAQLDTSSWKYFLHLASSHTIHLFSHFLPVPVAACPQFI